MWLVIFVFQLAELGSFGKTTGIGEATCYVQEFLSPEPKVGIALKYL